MSNMVPVNRDPVEYIRDSILDVFNRWMPRHWREDEPAMAWLGRGVPPIDVKEDERNVMISAELPGMTEKDFSVELQGETLLLRGEKKAEKEEKKENYFYSEFNYGSFSRAIPLPCEVDAAKAKAEYKNGVLHVTLPKAEEQKGRRVKIDVSK